MNIQMKTSAAASSATAGWELDAPLAVLERVRAELAMLSMSGASYPECQAARQRLHSAQQIVARIQGMLPACERGALNASLLPQPKASTQ